MNKKVSKFKIFSLLILVISSLFLVSCFETEEPPIEKIKEILNSVSIEYAHNNSSDKITDNFVVPTNINGISIEWLSSNEEVLFFDNETATITRLAYDIEVYITAQVTIDKITDYKTFKIIVLGIPLQEIGYQVTFYIDNEQYGQVQYVKEGSAAKAPTPPSKEGYEFIGWDKEFLNVERDLDIHGIYSPIEYTISYTDLFNTNHENPTIYTVEDEFILLPPSTRQGYTFIGWYHGSEKIDKISPGTTDNIILSARFEKNAYLVKFVDYDLREIKTEVVQHGLSATAPSNPTREGYTFKGWKQPFNSVTSDLIIEAEYSINTYKITYQIKDQNDIVQYFEYDSPIIGYKPDQIIGYSFSWDNPIPQNMPPRDLVFVGTYTPNQYKITYLVDGEEYLIKEYDFKEPITIIPNLVKEGHSFSWNPASLPETMPAENLVVKGTFTINTYTVTFIDYDDKVIDTQRINWNEAAIAPTVSERTGYTFTGWDVDFSNVKKDLTVKAKYSLNQYTITLVLDNGEDDVKITQNYDTPITSPTEPTKEGYEFIGWNPTLPSTMPSEDRLHTAQWEVKQYTVTYVVEDEENIVDTYDFGTEIIIRPLLEKEGYSFSWNPQTLPATMPANDLEVIGVFTINTYTVTFVDHDDEVIDVQTIKWNEAATAPTDPERTGYTFTGWDVAFDNVTSNLTVKAKYNVNQYTITYMVDGEQVGDVETYDFGTEISIRKILVRDGHSFSWNPTALPETMPAENLLVTGTFTINTYTVTFVDHDDEVIDVQTIKWNEAATAPTNPERTGYTFTGWDVAFDNVTSNLTVKAQWKAIIKTLTFNSDGGSEVASQELTYPNKTTKPVNPTKEGHEFLGWYLGETIFEFDNTLLEDATVIAKWKINQYTITYIVDGENYIVDTYDFGTDITLPNDPTKDGYSFVGWFINEDLEEAFTLSQMPADNINLFAKWTSFPVITLNLYDGEKVLIYQEPGTSLTIDSPTRTGYEFDGWDPALPSTMPTQDTTHAAQWKIKQYTITYMVDGEQVGDVETYDFGTEIAIRKILVRDGHSFSWNPTALPETMPAENLVVTGTFTINSYTVTFVDYDDEVIKTQTINWSGSATAPADPERTGYTFIGWDIEFNNIVEDVTVKAEYQINQYTITLVLDNGEADVKITQDFDTTITSPTDPEREGHEFIGWDSQIPSFMPAQDTTYTAQWKINQYTITYVVDGEDYIVATYDFGQEVTIPNNPTKEGHSFLKWDIEIPLTMPAKNITLTAVWEIHKFKVTFDVGEYQMIDYKNHIDYDEVPNALEVNSQWVGFEFYGWSIDGSENIIPRNFEVTENLHLTARFIKQITPSDIINSERFDIDDINNDQIIYKSKISNQEMPSSGIYAYLSFNVLTGIVLIDYKLPVGNLSSNYLTINDKVIASSSSDDWKTAKFINNYNQNLQLDFFKQGSQNEGSEVLISNIRLIVGEVHNTQFSVYENNDYGYGQLEVPPQPYLLGQIVEVTTIPEGEAAFVGFQVNQNWVYGNGDDDIYGTTHGVEVTKNNTEFIAYFKYYITLPEMSATINPGEENQSITNLSNNTTLQLVEDVDNLAILFNIINKDPLVKLTIKNNDVEILSTFVETFEIEFDASKRFNQIEVIFESDNLIKQSIAFEVLVFSSTKGLTSDRNINILNDLYYPYKLTGDGYESTNGRIEEDNISLLKLEVNVNNPLGGVLQFDFKLHTLERQNQNILIVYVGDERPVDATNSETRDNNLYTGVKDWQTYKLELSYGKHTVYIGYYRVWEEGLDLFLDTLIFNNIWLDDGTEELVLDFNIQGGNILVNGNAYDYNDNRYDRGAELELMPNPNPNHTFVYWLDFDGNIIYDWKITVLLDESKYYQAVFINTEIYKFRIGIDVYTSLEEAITNSIYGDVVILLGKQYTLDHNITIPEGVSLLIPLNEKDYEGFNVEMNLTTTSSEFFNPHGVVSGREKLYATFIINEGASLTVNGFVYVNAVTGRNQGGTQVQNISGDYSQIELNGKIIVSQSGVLESAGKIYGTGEIEVLPGGSFGETFVVRRWRGGSQAENQFGSLNMNGAFPFNEYEMPYVTTTIKIHSGAKYYGLVKMYAANRYYATKFNQFNNTAGLIQLSEGAYVVIDKEVTKNVLVESNQYTDVLVRATVTINGGATEIGGGLRVAGLYASTASMDSFYPINGNITLNLENGNYILNHNLKFLTGSIINVAVDATLIINKVIGTKPTDKSVHSQVAFYDEYVDRVTGATSYPNRPAAQFNLFGTLVIKGSMSGTITAYNGSTVETSADAIFEVSPAEANGWGNGFYYFHNVLRISPVNDDIIENIVAGEVYNF